VDSTTSIELKLLPHQGVKTTTDEDSNRLNRMNY